MKITDRTALLASVALLATAAAGSALADEASCTSYADRALPAAFTALPNGGAKVTQAEFVAPRGATGAYCKLLGQINSIDPKAHPILFQVNLPDAWNGKSLQYGGAGLNGTLITGLAPLRDMPPSVSTPVSQGYATYGTDAGHPNVKPDIQVFWANEEETINHSYAAYKKTNDLAQRLIVDYYGKAPTKRYFFGGSEGGREAMNSIQRYPTDYDGVVAAVPAIHWISGKLANNRTFRMSSAGGFLSAVELKLVRSATNAACDKLDGLEDGVISHYRSCATLANPETLRCPGGEDTGDTCLSDKQIGLVKAIRSPYVLPFPLKNGYTQFAGLSVGGEDMESTINPWIVDDEKLPADDLGQTHYGPATVRLLITGDPNYVGVPDPMQYKAQILRASELMDATDPDLSAFLNRGGKLILKENTADYTVAPEGNFAYFEDVKKKVGPQKVAAGIRFYVNPGVNHGGSGTQKDGLDIPDKVDLMSVLDKWVESGQVPGDLTVASFPDKGPFTPVASRPLCQYPEYPHYVSGDPKAAASFACRPNP